jgi:hypothetical protein
MGVRTVHHREGAFELSELWDATEQGGMFLFLKDSLHIIDPHQFWAAVDTGGPGWLFARPSCYLAVYESDSLRAALEDAPLTGSKRDSIDWESELHNRLPYPTIWPDVSDRTALGVELVNGEPELIIGVPGVVVKYKGTAHCGQEPWAPVPGLCSHYLARYACT